MCFKNIKSLIEQKQPSSRAKNLYLWLKADAEEKKTDTIWFKQAELAQTIGVSVRTLQRCLKELVDMKMIEKKEEKHEKKFPVYQIQKAEEAQPQPEVGNVVNDQSEIVFETRTHSADQKLVAAGVNNIPNEECVSKRLPDTVEVCEKKPTRRMLPKPPIDPKAYTLKRYAICLPVVEKFNKPPRGVTPRNPIVPPLTIRPYDYDPADYYPEEPPFTIYVLPFDPAKELPAPRSFSPLTMEQRRDVDPNAPISSLGDIDIPVDCEEFLACFKHYLDFRYPHFDGKDGRYTIEEFVRREMGTCAWLKYEHPMEYIMRQLAIYDGLYYHGILGVQYAEE